MDKKQYPCRNNYLTPFIDDYTFLDFISNTDTPMSIPPLGFPVIQFHYGEKANFYNRREFPDESIIIGQITRHIKLKPIAGTRLIGINFKPYGLFNMFGIEPGSFTDSAVLSKAFFGESKTEDVIQQLKKASSHQEIVAIIEEFLIQAMKYFDGYPASYFDSIVDTMIADQGMSKIEEYLSENMKIRSLQRYFHQVIGINPKLFTQILRHKFILHKFYENTDIKWCDAAFNGFYYDYSHFSRDFVKFTEQKPIEYLQIKNKFAEGMV